jgi:GNAT superfamily N-acetyltransferase
LTPPSNADYGITKLSSAHVVTGFDCGRDDLNRFLIRHALANQQIDDSQTYVAPVEGRVVGFYTLAVGSVEYDVSAPSLRKGRPTRSIPIMLLARLAVDLRWQGRGIGKTLLKDAMLRTIQAADIAGICAVIVHAKDQRAREFYEHFDFVPSPTDTLQLFVTLKDLRQVIRG